MQLLYIPALEATLVYDPADNKVHVLSDRQSTAKRLADRFSLIGFDKPLSKQPVDAVSYELAMFKNRIDLKAAKATGGLLFSAEAENLIPFFSDAGKVSKLRNPQESFHFGPHVQHHLSRHDSLLLGSPDLPVQ